MNIIITNATEGNLKNITLEIPKEKLVVFTGLSGSGKSTLLKDVLMVECQRQYLEAMGLQGIGKPKVDSIKNLSPSILITQTDQNRNPRSTVGTITDIYTDLRMIYEKLGVRECPHCNQIIKASSCREETEKIEDDFNVYMYCSHCNYKMHKLTRTDFSFNTKEGACKACEGLGRILSVNKKKTVDETLSLEEGAVYFWEQKYKEYQIQNLYQAFNYYEIPVNQPLPVSDFTDIQKQILYYGVDNEKVRKAFPHKDIPRKVADGRFEGIIPILLRRLAEKGQDNKRVNEYFDDSLCPDCNGERLSELSRKVTVMNKRLPEIAMLSMEEIYEWIQTLDESLSDEEKILIAPYLLDVRTKVDRLKRVGIGYLSLDRQTITLSGGELQRLRLAAALDCDLTGIIYIMDEPTIGLHKRDTKGIIEILKRLRDLGNSVLIIEHDEDVMKEADHIIDIGPGAGKQGGRIVGEGTLQELKRQPKSVTGRFFSENHFEKVSFRKGSGVFSLKNARKYNLKGIDVDFKEGCLTVVTGVSGSGKSTLVFEELPNQIEDGRFHKVITVEQSAISRMKRSNIATYSEAYGEIRKIFANTEAAKTFGFTSKHFSFNTKGGRCENCEGLGYITSNLLFFENIDVICPSCQGKRFTEKVLSVKYEDYSINDILRLSVDEAFDLFQEYLKLEKILGLLKETGLGYLELGQTLTTLSGGEGQRLKLAKELMGSRGKNNLYLLDEPTTGLHPYDVEKFLVLLDKIVDAGNTVIVVEHNEQVIHNCDWNIHLGPEGGNKGGYVMFTGTPPEIKETM